MKKNNSWTRRDFIAKPAVFLAASQLLSHSNPLLAEAATPAPAATKKIITRTLGKTGISVPIISMGFAGSDTPGIVKRAYEAGVRLFDTAAMYQGGKNEVMLGNTIKEMGVRKDVILATKALDIDERRRLPNPAQAGPRFKEQFENSLKSLQTEYVDILYLHLVANVAEVSMEGPLQVMLALKKEGKVRAIGISMHDTEPILNEVMRLGVHDVVLFPFNCTMASDQALLSAIDRAHQKGIGILAMKTGAGGSQPPGAHTYDTSGATHSALQKWALHHEAIGTIVTSFGSYDHIEQNLAIAYDLSYTDEEKKILADKELMASLEFCHQCGQCKSTCPNGAEIPTLMRTHMYALQYYPGTGHPHETLASIPAGRGLEACSNCDICTASCAWTVNIPRKIAQLQAWPGLA